MTDYNSATVTGTIGLLNQALAADRTAISKLMAYRVECNELLGEHPTIPCGQLEKDGPLTIGLLSIINGLFDVLPGGYGRITMVLDGDDVLHFAESP